MKIVFQAVYSQNKRKGYSPTPSPLLWLVPPLERCFDHSCWTNRGQSILWDIAQVMSSLQHFLDNPTLHHLWKSKAICKNRLGSNPYILYPLYPMSRMRTGARSCHGFTSHKTRLDTKLMILLDFFFLSRALKSISCSFSSFLVIFFFFFRWR